MLIALNASAEALNVLDSILSLLLLSGTLLRGATPFNMLRVCLKDYEHYAS
jgi:hypothetical protein